MARRLAAADWPAAIALTALNLAICWRLFKVEFTGNFASIEGAFISIARYISHHWSDFGWWPLWHCGMPYQDTYVPLLHLIVALTATVGHLSAARAYHAVIGVTYALGPATLYLMAVRLGARRGAAFTAGLFYSLVSPSALILPEMARDLGGLWFGRRLQVLTVYGEGPHVSAMTMLPVAILALENVLRKGTGRALALAAIATAVVFLTNVPGTMALGLAVFCWICAQPEGRREAAWMAAGAASALAYCMACFGVPPSAVNTVVGNVGPMHHGFRNSLRYGPAWLLLALVAVWAAGWVLARVRAPLAARWAALYFGLTALLVTTANTDVFELLPQAGRLHLEMEMGACLLLGMAAWALYSLIPVWVRPLVLTLCLAPAVVQFQNYRERARLDISYADLNKRSEYTTARWLDANLQGHRVYVAGSTSFWLNAFTEVPQAVGCCDQGQSLPILKDVPFLINAGVEAPKTRLAAAYLRTMGAAAIVVNGPESSDEYKDIKAPERFAGLFDVLHRENGDTVYAVSQGPYSLAHVLRPGEALRAGASRPEEDAAAARYAAAFADATRPPAEFTWLRGDEARIRANLRRGDLILAQVGWFSGWKVRANGRRVKAGGDGFGFMLIEPECEGACEVTVRWQGRPDLPFAAAISGVGIGLAVVLWRRKKLLRPPVSPVS